MIYLELFFAFLQVGLFSIGGGHASIPVAQGIIVEKKGFLSMEEFTTMITVSEMTPGPFSINSATFVGLKMAGVIGGIVATLGFLFPSIIICPLIYFIIKKLRSRTIADGIMRGIKPAVSGLISSAGVSMILLALFGASTLGTIKDFNPDLISVIIFCVALFVSKKYKVNSVVIILISGALGLFYYI